MEYKDVSCQPSKGKHPGVASAQNIEQTISQFASKLRSRFRDQIARDAREFKKLVLRLMRRELPPRPGRPNDPRLDAACRMIHQGKTVKQVLRVQVPDFDRLDTYGRYLAEKGLRAALVRRRRIRSQNKAGA
jgi:hypothetical protein